MTEQTTFLAFAGRRADGKPIKSTVPQFDGSFHASGNCAACSEAVRDITEQASRGTDFGDPWPPTGAIIRKATGDTVGGLTPFQTAAVSKRLYLVGSDIRIVPWSVVIDKLRQGFAVTLLVRYRPISDAGQSGSPGFFGNHSITLLGIRGKSTNIEILYTDSLRDGRRAGIPEGPVWMKIKVLKAAARQLMITDTKSLGVMYGSNKAYCSFGLTPWRGPVEGTKPVVGAKKFKRPRRVKVEYDRTNLRTRPRKRAANVARLVDKGWRFDAYWHVENADGRWLGNKTKTRWVYRPGVSFVKYL